LALIFGETEHDRHVLALDITAILQAAVKSEQKMRGRASRRSCHEQSDYRHRRPLRPRHHRPRRCCAAEQRDELAPPHHSITSSAATSNFSGTVSPSILAVCWLITSSNLLDCTTGKSSGLAPLRMRPV